MKFHKADEKELVFDDRSLMYYARQFNGKNCNY